MTVKKAIKGLDMLLENKQKMKTDILSPKMLGDSNEPIIKSLANTFDHILQRDIE